MLTAFHILLNYTARWLLLVVTVMTLPTLLYAQSPLSDDAQTSNTTKSADKNFGSTATLTVSPSSNAYLKFRLNSTLPEGTTRANIAKATIKLYIGGISSPGKIDVYQVAEPWEEAALTFNTAPISGNVIATSRQIELEMKNEFLVIDVTSAVQDWLDDGQGTNGAPNYGLVLVPHPVGTDTPALANITFDSKENTQTSHEPQLLIAFARPTALQTVSHDASLSGDGTSANPLAVNAGSIGTTQLASNSVTGDKVASGTLTAQNIAMGEVVKSVNGVTDNVTLRAGANVTIQPSGSTLTISASGGGLPAVSHNATLTGDGTVGAPLSVVVPLTLIGPQSTASPTLMVTSQGGTAISAHGVVDSTSYYSIAGSRMLSKPGFANTFVGERSGATNSTGSQNAFFGTLAGHNNTQGLANSFFGNNAGAANTAGSSNSFMGQEAGFSNTTGESNSFFGRRAGQANTTGGSNAFFGHGTGMANTSGSSNAFFGTSSGFANSMGNNNSFFGYGAGRGNTIGVENTFLGADAGSANTAGIKNTFVGSSAGRSNTSESFNTFIGVLSDGAPGITNATALGYGAVVQKSNAVVLGNHADVGIGINLPKARLHLAGGKIYVETPGQGIVLKSANGICIEITAGNTGTLQYGPIACP